MKVQHVVKLGKAYLTEDILKAFSQWGEEKDYSTTEAAGAIVGWYNLPVRGYIELGSRRKKSRTFEDSLHRGKKFWNILLTIVLDDKAVKDVSIVSQYAEFKRKEGEALAELEKVGLFIKDKLATQEPAST